MKKATPSKKNDQTPSAGAPPAARSRRRLIVLLLAQDIPFRLHFHATPRLPRTAAPPHAPSPHRPTSRLISPPPSRHPPPTRPSKQEVRVCVISELIAGTSSKMIFKKTISSKELVYPRTCVQGYHELLLSEIPKMIPGLSVNALAASVKWYHQRSAL